MPLKMQRDDLHRFMKHEFPQTSADYVVESVIEYGINVRMPVSDRNLRPGGTVSGPSIFGLADVAFYLAILAMIGPVALAVTTNCSIDFMRKPAAGRDLVAEAHILKLGKSLAVGDVLVYSEGETAPVARAGMTYSIPPKLES